MADGELHDGGDGLGVKEYEQAGNAVPQGDRVIFKEPASRSPPSRCRSSHYAAARGVRRFAPARRRRRPPVRCARFGVVLATRARTIRSQQIAAGPAIGAAAPGQARGRTQLAAPSSVVVPSARNRWSGAARAQAARSVRVSWRRAAAWKL